MSRVITGVNNYGDLKFNIGTQKHINSRVDNITEHIFGRKTWYHIKIDAISRRTFPHCDTVVWQPIQVFFYSPFTFNKTSFMSNISNTHNSHFSIDVTSHINLFVITKSSQIYVCRLALYHRVKIMASVSFLQFDI